jgi:hypothetical protein
MNPQDKPQGWSDETLVDKLDIEIQVLELVVDHLELKIERGEAMTPEELAKVAAVMGSYLRAYGRAREDWISVIS